MTRHRPRWSGLRHTVTVTGFALVLGSCGGDDGMAPEDQPGAIRVSVSTDGQDPDEDGYTVLVDGESSATVAADGTVTVGDVSPGTHTVGLTDGSGNCNVEVGRLAGGTGGIGANPLTVDVSAGETVGVEFEVYCGAVTGSVRFSVATLGDAPDPDGYAVTIGGGTTEAVEQALPVTGAVTIEGIPPGDRNVAISGISENCRAPHQLTTYILFDLTAGETRELSLNVICPPFGDHIFFWSDRAGGGDLHVMAADGSSPIRLTGDDAVDYGPVLSPDGMTLAFGSTRDGNEEIYLMDLVTGEITRFTTDPGTDRHATWSPDGSALAFHSDRDGSLDVWVRNLDGSGLANVTAHTALDGYPAWSPDGSRILFTSTRAGDEDLWLIDPDGSDPVQLTDTTGIDYDATWAPDGSRIAFTVSDGVGYDIYVMNSDGSGRTRLTPNSAADLSPSWSPDASMIAFESDRTGQPEVYVMNADGSDVRNLTQTPSVWDGSPWWSRPPIQAPAEAVVTPGADTLHAVGDSLALAATVRDADGNEIAFADVSWSTSDTAIATVDADGLVIARENGTATVAATSGTATGDALIHVEQVLADIVVSPDSASAYEGDTLRFSATPVDSNGVTMDSVDVAWSVADTSVATVDATGLVTGVYEGRTDVIATATGEGVSGAATFEVPGQIAFASNRDVDYDLYIMYTDGSGLTHVTDDAPVDVSPAWSPDGTRIAFHGNHAGNADIYVMNADGSDVNALTSSGLHDVTPAWSPDGTRIAFVSNQDDDDGTVEYELYVMNADGTGVTQLTHDTNADALYSDWSPGGTRIVFADSEVITTISPDGSEPVALWNGGTSPSWSPDARRIVFETAAGLYVMNADGSDPVHVPNTGADDFAPAWRPNPRP